MLRVCCNDVVHFLHADRCMPVQVMLMRRRGYGVGTEGHIDLVCYRFVSTALQCYRVMGVERKIKRESALVAKKEQLNNMYSVKIRGKTLEGSKISADVRWPILNSTASYNLTPPLSECLWGKEETWLCPSIIQYVCVLALVSIHVCICVPVCDMMSCLTGQVPNFALNLPGDYNIQWHRVCVPPSPLNGGI